MRFLKSVRERTRGPEGNPCRYCGRPTSRASGPEQSHADHVDPMSRGGHGTEDNAVNACAKCNWEKGARPPEEWTPRWYQRGKAPSDN
ncbi:MAG: HNH endonuclease signature motif containing protein, partial [Gemmatimonadaceae bacterium]